MRFVVRYFNVMHTCQGDQNNRFVNALINGAKLRSFKKIRFQRKTFHLGMVKISRIVGFFLLDATLKPRFFF